MKRLIALILLFCVFVSPTTLAAPKKIVVKPMQLITSVGSPDEVGGIVISGKNLIVFGTQNSKAYVRALDLTGKEMWKLVLDSFPASIATAAAVDANGDIWVAGSTPLDAELALPANPAVPINPDNAEVPPVSYINNLQTITIWKVSAVGLLVATYLFPTSFVVLPTAAVADNAGVSVVGVLAREKINAGFLINIDFFGNFSKLLQIGSVNTSAEAVIRNNDGSFIVTGSSTETIGDKKLVGKADGIIVKISKTFKISSIVRSSNAKGKRNWVSATPSLLLGGEVVAASKSEIAVTKFSSALVPMWTHRFPGNGYVQTIGSTQLLFLSSGPVSQLTWNPKVPTPLLITFDSKGAITAANSVLGGQNAVVGALNSQELGVLAITSNSKNISVYSR